MPTKHEDLPRPSVRPVGRPRHLVVLVLALAAPGAALAQGTGGRFPDPRAGWMVSAWLEAVGVDPATAPLARPIHARYLAEVERLRDGEIEQWVVAGAAAWMEPRIDAEERLARVAARAAAQRRLVERLAQLEDSMWTEVGEEVALDDARLGMLKARGERRRALDMRLDMLGMGQPVDLLEVIERLECTAEEAALVRERLADHDGRLSEALRAVMDEQIDRSIREAEAIVREVAAQESRRRAVEEETRLAKEEGRDPRIEEAMASVPGGEGRVEIGLDLGQARRVRMQQIESLARLQGLLADDRVAELLSSLGHGPSDPIRSFMREKVDATLARGGVSAEVAAALVEARASYHRERLDLMLRIAREEAGGPVAMEWTLGEDGEQVPPPDWTRRQEMGMRLSASLPQEAQDRVLAILGEGGEGGGGDAARREVLAGRQGVVGAAGGEGDFTFTAGISIAVATSDGVELEGVPAMGGAMVAMPISVSAMSIEIGEGGVIRMVPQAFAPPLRGFDAAAFARMLTELGVADEMRIVAEQIRLDAESEIAAIVREAAEAPQDPSAVEVGFLDMGPDVAVLDAALGRALAADAAMFDALLDLLGDESAERLAPWRDWRVVELVAATAGLRGDDGSLARRGIFLAPWEGSFASIDVPGIVREVAPRSTEDPAVAEALVEHLRRWRPAVEGYWAQMRSVMPALREMRRTMFMPRPAVSTATEDPVEVARRASERHRELFRLEEALPKSRRAMSTLMREELARIEAVLPDDAARSFHAAARRAGWSEAVPEMSALEGMNAAMRLLAADEAAMTRLAEIEEGYLARSDALFASLDQLAADPPRRARPEQGAGASPPGRLSSEGATRWQSVVGRLQFRHRELDDATIEELRELVGPAHADSIRGASPTPARVRTIFFGG